MHTFAKPSQKYSISSEGLQQMLRRPKDPNFPGRHVSWTDDIRVELPIRVSDQGVGAEIPTTLIDQFKRTVKQYGNLPALSSKRTGKWQTINFQQYYDLCVTFASSLLAYNFPEYTSVNIIGFNSVQWAVSFFGSLFARALATGIYTTNSLQICEYIVENSDCQVVIAENMAYAEKYLSKLSTNQVKLIVLYHDPKADISQYKGKIVRWNDFMNEGRRVDVKSVQERMNKSKPGNCATLVYTSGTTGMPKGVMLSHDNLTWTKRSMDAFHDRQDLRMRMVSYLPLSHVAGLFSDLITPLMNAYHVYFANPDALQGSLIQTLTEVRPNAFFSVPRVWQKIDDKMKQVAKQNGWLKTKIATWAKSIGPQGTVQQVRDQPTSWQFKLAKTLVYNQVKKRLGLDQCTFFLFGAAPLDPVIRQYFLSLNIFLINTYGMSQSTGPQNFTHPEKFQYNTLKAFREVGCSIPGTQLKLVKLEQKDQDGQICYRGRNTFMGYFKKAEETKKALDENGFLHSGDMGVLNEKGVLFITGRAKELIITAGGQNIPPVLIENQLKSAMPFIANVMVVGEGKKYLNCLIALREDPPASGKIQKSAKQYLSIKGVEANTIEQARNNPKFAKLVQQGLKIANSKAVSRAQYLQNFLLLPEDFSVENGMLTPTLKLKRKEVIKKYNNEIEKLYTVAKL